MSESLKRCTKCGQDKPLDEFYPRKDRGGIAQSMCAKCNNKPARTLTRKRLINRRARQRATAVLVDSHRDEFRDLMASFLPVVEQEFESVGADTTVRFMPGPAARNEDRADRIADPRCVYCVSHHAQGHSCTSCGLGPDDEALPKKSRRDYVLDELQLLLGTDHPGSIARRLGYKSGRELARALHRWGRSDLARKIDTVSVA